MPLLTNTIIWTLINLFLSLLANFVYKLLNAVLMSVLPHTFVYAEMTSFNEYCLLYVIQWALFGAVIFCSGNAIYTFKAANLCKVCGIVSILMATQDSMAMLIYGKNKHAAALKLCIFDLF